MPFRLTKLHSLLWTLMPRSQRKQLPGPPSPTATETVYGGSEEDEGGGGREEKQKGEAMQKEPALVTLRLSQGSHSIIRRFFHVGKWRTVFPQLSCNPLTRAPPGCLVTALSFSVNRWKGTSMRRSVGKPTFLSWTLATRTLGDSGQNLCPSPFADLNLPI